MASHAWLHQHVGSRRDKKKPAPNDGKNGNQNGGLNGGLNIDPKALPSPVMLSAVSAPIVNAASGPGPDPPQDVKTLTRQVFITMPPSFSGPIGGMSTIIPVNNHPQDPPAGTYTSGKTSPANAPSSTPTSSPIKSPTSAMSSSVSSGDPVSSSSSSASSTTFSTSSISADTAATSSSSTGLAASPAGASSVTSPDANSPFSQDSGSGGSDGLSAGSKAGIAIGMILLVGAIAVLLVFCLRRRKKKAGRQPLDDEKDEVVFVGERTPSLRSVRAVSTAPRLSLRPVTQFQPILGNNRNTGIQLSPVPPLTTTPTLAEEVSSLRAVERPPSNESQNKTDPFGNHAEAIDPVNAAGPPVVDAVDPAGDVAAAVSPGADTLDKDMEGAATATGVTEDTVATGIVTAAEDTAATGVVTVAEDTATAGIVAAAEDMAAAAVTAETTTTLPTGLIRSASKLGNAPKALDLTKKSTSPDLPSPALTEFSSSSETSGGVSASAPTTGARAIAAAGGPPNSTVHRVQLDFSPSMDDELPLRAGQLVRLLHEYDDGWALCIRLDRSAQGVAPRTCLSTRPVKPRVNNVPRVNPPAALRPGPPPQGRPASPALGQRAASPAMGMGQRPASPAMSMGQRPASPSNFPPPGRPSSPYKVQPVRPLTTNGGPQYIPQNRSMTPTNARPHSPVPGRPQSPAQHSRRNSPPSASPTAQDVSRSPTSGSISRKPVSGQAM